MVARFAVKSRRAYLLMPWGRVGSNVLLSMFGDNPLVHVENEPLTVIGGKKSEPDLAQKSWYIKSISEDISKPVLLMNLSIRSILDHNFFLNELAKERGAEFIFLSRKNLAHIAFSVLKARHYAELHKARFGRETWAVKAGREIKAQTPVRISKFMELIDLIESDKIQFDTYRKRLGGVDTYYSDIQMSLSMVVEELCGRFDIPVPSSKPQFVKAITRPYEDEFEGYAELVEHISEVRPDLLRYF